MIFRLVTYGFHVLYCKLKFVLVFRASLNHSFGYNNQLWFAESQKLTGAAQGGACEPEAVSSIIN